MILISIYAENLSKRVAGSHLGSWFDLPVPISEFNRKLVLDENSEYLISDYEAPFKINEYDSIKLLNEKVKKLELVPKIYQDNADSLVGLKFNNFDDFVENWANVTFSAEIHNDEELGIYLVDNDYLHVPSDIENYFDYEAYGRDHRINTGAFYTDDGVFAF